VDIFVTVGMSPWPFDRLLRGVAPLCMRHRVFAQTGTSPFRLPCAQRPYVPYTELLERIRTADVVITHAGNTVRLVQRAAKVPIAVARTAAAHEMPNDHQVQFLRHEERTGRVVAVWDVAELEAAVAGHRGAELALLAERPLPDPVADDEIARVVNRLWQGIRENPFARHHLRRYAYAWEELYSRRGSHLDVGCGTGEFLRLLAETTELKCYGVDPNGEELAHLRAAHPRLRLSRVAPGGRLPFADASFDSVSLLDVLEHAESEDALLAEISRVLAPQGVLVVTVPGRHVFSGLDPDNVKFRAPRVHRLVYSARFGRDVYRRRFVDTSNGLFGDMSIGKRKHTNYRRQPLVDCLATHGLDVVRVSGANLFWRWFQIPALLLGPRLGRPFEHLVYLDGRAFRSANLFLTARKVT
jgi:SAM-dependent methyltransferase/UDP-N-acetylglucosamine transferase subunit ALG13